MQATIQDVRARSRWLKHVATAIFATLLLALVFEAAMAARAPSSDSALRFLLPYRLAMLFYLSAIWTMRRAFGQIGDGEPFDSVLPNLLLRLGLALSGGAVVSVFLSPLLLRLSDGFRRGSFAAFDPPAITIGLVGLMLVILSKLFARAVAVHRELDEFL